MAPCRYSWKQKIVADCLQQLVINTITVQRLLRMRALYGITDMDVPIGKFRQRCSRALSYEDGIHEFCLSMLQCANDTRSGIRIVTASPTVRRRPPSPSTQELRNFRPPKRNRLVLFNRGIAKRIRLYEGADHNIETRAQGMCTLCGRGVTSSCSVCRVILCQRVRDSWGRSCFAEFHSSDELRPE